MQAARLANWRNEKELALEIHLSSSLYWHPSAFWNSKKFSLENSKYIHVLALYQLALGSLLVSPILLPLDL